jgi:hypothetical protein
MSKIDNHVKAMERWSIGVANALRPFNCLTL